MATSVNDVYYLTPQQAAMPEASAENVPVYGNIDYQTNVPDKLTTPGTMNEYESLDFEILQEKDSSERLNQMPTSVAAKREPWLGNVCCFSSGIIIFVLTAAISLTAGFFLSKLTIERKTNTSRSSNDSITMPTSQPAMGTAQPTPCICLPGWFQMEQTCYLLGAREKKFSDAVTFCHERKASLVCPKSNQENDFLKSAMHARNQNENVWLGITLNVSTGKWRCYNDQSQLTFEDWGGEEPNGHNIGLNETCVVFYGWLAFQWGDILCFDKDYPLCKRECSIE